MAATPMVAAPEPAPSLQPGSFAEMVARLNERTPRLAAELHDCVSLVRYAPPALDIRLLQPLDADFARQVAAALKDMTGEPWTVTMSDANGEPSLRDQQAAQALARRAAISATPVVAAALAAFPGAALAEPDGRN